LLTLISSFTAIETDLSRDQDDELTAQFYKVAPYWKTPDEGSSTTLVAALDPALNGELMASTTSRWRRRVRADQIG